MVTKITGNASGLAQYPKRPPKEKAGKSKNSPEDQGAFHPHEQEEENGKLRPLSLTKTNIQNILDQLGNSHYYQEKELFFTLHEEPGGFWIEVAKKSGTGSGAGAGTESQFIQKLSVDQLLELWIAYKIGLKSPPKGGLFNIRF